LKHKKVVKLISSCPYKDHEEAFSTVVLHLVLKGLGISVSTQCWLTTARKICWRKSQDKVSPAALCGCEMYGAYVSQGCQPISKTEAEDLVLEDRALEAAMRFQGG
jgi:hypothetical protein